MGLGSRKPKILFPINMVYRFLYLPHVKEEVMVGASSQITTMKEASSDDEANTWEEQTKKMEQSHIFGTQVLL